MTKLSRRRLGSRSCWHSVSIPHVTWRNGCDCWNRPVQAAPDGGCVHRCGSSTPPSHTACRGRRPILHRGDPRDTSLSDPSTWTQSRAYMRVCCLSRHQVDEPRVEASERISLSRSARASRAYSSIFGFMENACVMEGLRLPGRTQELAGIDPEKSHPFQARDG